MERNPSPSAAARCPKCVCLTSSSPLRLSPAQSTSGATSGRRAKAGKDPIGQIDHRTVRPVLRRETGDAGEKQRVRSWNAAGCSLRPDLDGDPARGNPVGHAVPSFRCFGERPGDEQVAIGGIVHIGDRRTRVQAPSAKRLVRRRGPSGWRGSNPRSRRRSARSLAATASNMP